MGAATTDAARAMRSWKPNWPRRIATGRPHWPRSAGHWMRCVENWANSIRSMPGSRHRPPRMRTRRTTMRRQSRCCSRPCRYCAPRWSRMRRRGVMRKNWLPRSSSIRSAAHAVDPDPTIARRRAQGVKPLRVMREQFVLLAVEDAGQRQRTAGLQVQREVWRQIRERPGEDVRDEHVGLHLWKMLRKIQIQVIGDVVALRVVAAGGDGLFVVVHADRARGAELERGDGEDARAAAVIDQRLAGEIGAVEPFQA